MKKDTSKKKLVVRIETIRELDQLQLAAVNGGGTGHCTIKGPTCNNTR
jgi:hypothetical protein